MLNDYDGVQHDYTKKHGLVWQHVFLPPMAPPEWADREILWNAVEENEKTKDSRLAREFVISLPIELDRDEQINLIFDFIQTQFVAEDMCADVAIHDTDGHNPHAHIMLTVRPLNANGTWQHKTEKEYRCVKDGEERGFTAAEYKDAQHDGWEKQYPYWISKKKKEYMTPSEAAAHGYERASKYAKSTKYGRQNPISARWNGDKQLIAWRKAWADAVNLLLEHKGLDERIDHRGHAERGLEEQPTIHEGVIARAMEAKGFISDRCELNRQIKADNALLRLLRETFEKLTAEKKALSSLHVKRHLELAAAISGLTEEIEELRSQKKRILARAKCADDKDMKVFAANLEQAKRNYNDLIERKTALTAERQDGITQYEDIYEKIQPGDEEAVREEQRQLRAESESRLSETVAKIYGGSFDPNTLSDATKETDLDLVMDRRVSAHRQNIRQEPNQRHPDTHRAFPSR